MTAAAVPKAEGGGEVLPGFDDTPERPAEASRRDGNGNLCYACSEKPPTLRWSSINGARPGESGEFGFASSQTHKTAQVLRPSLSDQTRVRPEQSSCRDGGLSIVHEHFACSQGLLLGEFMLHACVELGQGIGSHYLVYLVCHLFGRLRSRKSGISR